MSHNYNRRCYDPITASVIALGVAGTAAAGSSMYSANKEASAAKKAADVQREIGLAQIQAPIDAENAAAASAKEKRKLLMAQQSNTILTSPLGTTGSGANTTQKTILGVG